MRKMGCGAGMPFALAITETQAMVAPQLWAPDIGLPSRGIRGAGGSRRMMVHILQRLPRIMWRHKLVLAGFALLIVAPIVVLATGGTTVLASRGLSVSATNGANSDRPPPMAEANMKALMDLDAQAFWNTLSEESKAQLSLQGLSSPQDLDRIFARARATGDNLLGYRFIARYDMQNGDTVSFFVATRGSVASDQEEVTYLVTTDKQGYVKKIE